nr:hypothetical protein [Tanacetum cinerariifolium]
MILESIGHGPLIWPTIEENRVTRTNKYVELSATEKLQANCDMKTINIILEGLPTKIDSLVNHHRVAKDLWEKFNFLCKTILLGLPEDIYAAVDSCETAQEIWLRVQQMMKGSDIGIQEKKSKLFNERERFTSTDGELIESYLLHSDQPSFNQNYIQQPMLNPEDITDLTTAMNMALALMAKAFKLNYSTPTNNNQRISSNPRNKQIAQPADLDAIEEVNANCILMANLQQASTSGTQTNKVPVYDSDGSAEVHNYENCYDDEIFNMFTQEEQYTELLEPIPKPHQVPQNDNTVISEVSSVEQSGGTVEQHPANVEKTRVLYDSLYNNLAIEVEKVNTVNRKLREINAELTTELARFKNQEKCFEISQEKYDKLERCYQKTVYQEQCLSKKINFLHLSSGKQIMTLNEEISDVNKQLSMEKSTVSSLLEEKKKFNNNLGKLQPKADIGILIGYAPIKKAFWIYNRRTRRIVETIHVDSDELKAMASEQSSLGPTLNEITLATISSGLMQKSSPSTSYVPPSKNDWDLLFQPMFDELLNPPPSVDHPAAEVIALIADVIPQVQADSTGSPSSMTVDQDAPSPSKSHTTAETQSSVIPQDVEDDNLDIEVAHMENDPLLGVPIPEVTSA